MNKLPFILREPASDGSAAGSGGAGGGAGDKSASSLFNDGSKAGAGGGAADAGGKPAGGGDGGAGGAKVAPWFAELYDTTGKINKATLDRLPESMAKFKGVYGKYETFEAMMHGLGHAASLAAGKALARPEAGAPAETVAAFNKQVAQLLGVPDKPDGYGIAKPEKLPEGVTWDDAATGKFLDILHKGNVSPETAKALFSAQMEMVATQAAQTQAAQQQALAAAVGKLQQEVAAQGGSFVEFRDQSDRGLALAAKLAGVPVATLTALARQSPDFAAMTKVFNAFGKLSREDARTGNDRQQGGGSAGGLDAQIKALRDSKEYNSQDEAVRIGAVKEIMRLQELKLAIS